MEKCKKLSNIDARQMLLSMYETYFGIYDHLAIRPPTKARPLALVALHECEENNETSSIGEMINAYSDREIMKYFGLSLLEFLELPREYNIKLQEIVLRKQQVETTTVNNLLNTTKLGK